MSANCPFSAGHFTGIVLLNAGHRKHDASLCPLVQLLLLFNSVSFHLQQFTASLRVVVAWLHMSCLAPELCASTCPFDGCYLEICV